MPSLHGSTFIACGCSASRKTRQSSNIRRSLGSGRRSSFSPGQTSRQFIMAASTCRKTTLSYTARGSRFITERQRRLNGARCRCRPTIWRKPHPCWPAANFPRPPTLFCMRPKPSDLARLRRLHAAAGELAASAPDVLTHPEAARSLEEALTPGDDPLPDRRRASRDGSQLSQPPDGHGQAGRLLGGEPEAAALSFGDLRRNACVRTYDPDLLSGASWHGASALSMAAADASGAPCAAHRERAKGHGNLDRHGAWLLGARPLFCRVPGPLRGNADRNASTTCG